MSNKVITRPATNFRGNIARILDAPISRRFRIISYIAIALFVLTILSCFSIDCFIYPLATGVDGRETVIDENGTYYVISGSEPHMKLRTISPALYRRCEVLDLASVVLFFFGWMACAVMFIFMLRTHRLRTRSLNHINNFGFRQIASSFEDEATLDFRQHRAAFVFFGTKFYSDVTPKRLVSELMLAIENTKRPGSRLFQRMFCEPLLRRNRFLVGLMYGGRLLIKIDPTNTGSQIRVGRLDLFNALLMDTVYCVVILKWRAKALYFPYLWGTIFVGAVLLGITGLLIFQRQQLFRPMIKVITIAINRSKKNVPPPLLPTGRGEL